MTTRTSALRAVRLLLRTAANREPGCAALRDDAGELSYAELCGLANSAAGWLRAHGVRPGDRVVVRAAANRTTVAVLFGCLSIGAVFVPYSTDATRYHLTDLLADAQPVLVVTDDEQQEGWIPVRVTGPAAIYTTPAREHVERDVAPDDLALLLYTSGSTAQPKAVACTHAQVSFAVSAVAAAVRYHADDVVFCRLPLSFDYGLYQVFLTFSAGGTLVLADADHDARLLADLRDHRATVVPVVPSLARMLLALAARRSSNPESPCVRLFTNTGEHLSNATADELRDRFPGASVQMMFGTTECKRIAVLEPDGDRRRPGSVGRPLPGTRVRILGDGGRELAPAEIGEICVHGPHVMAGYWRAPELTAARFPVDETTGERFLRTGDFGYLDQDGHLYFAGRRDHLFKLRGTRTSTVEIEAAALLLPGVTQAAVLPPEGDLDAVLCVIASVTEEEVVRGLRDRLGPAKVPSLCRRFESLPLTVNGKVDRRRLRELLEGSVA